MTLPTEDSERAQYPIWTYLSEYFPNATLAVVKHSYDANVKHNGEGSKMQWNYNASVGDGNQLMRHLWEAMDAAEKGEEDLAAYHFAAVHWRAAELHERFLTKMEPFFK